MLKGPKHLWNLHDNIFIVFLRNYELNWLETYLS